LILNRPAHLQQTAILMPAKDGEWTLKTRVYRQYQFSDVTDCAVAADGLPRSMTSIFGTGAGTALVFGSLLAVGAGALVATRNDMALVAMKFSDGKRALAQIKKVEVIKLQFALDATAAQGRPTVAAVNAARLEITIFLIGAAEVVNIYNRALSPTFQEH
jgi:hypothetical protein